MEQRSLFDPELMAAPKRAPAPTSAPATPWTVTELATRIDAALRERLAGVIRVVGEVSGPRERTHLYFDLKDAGAVVNCVMFASVARAAKVRPADGRAFVVAGRIDYYAKGGKLTLIAESLEPVGAGSRQEELRRLTEEARALGWLDPARKRPLPIMPRRVAVVTSRSGAALQDVLATMLRRCPGVGVVLVDTRVQGEGAGAEIAAAIRDAWRQARALGIDVLIVTRGGGSAEDLWAFNERAVAEAVVSCPIPVVAAIGHETDVTLAELVADERCATPTQAAMRVTPDRADLLRQLESLRRRLASGVVGSLREGRDRSAVDARRLAHAALERVLRRRESLSGIAARLARVSPTSVLESMRSRVEASRDRLDRAIHGARSRHDPEAMRGRLTRAVGPRVARAADRLASLARHLDAIAPARVLERGYSVTLRESGGLVRAPHDVRPGDALRTILASGEVRSIVAPPGATRRPPP